MFKDNNDLDTIKIVVKNPLKGTVSITGNTKLKSVHLFADPGIVGGTGAKFSIENNPLLNTIDMENLAKIELGGDFVVKGNAMLKTINVEKLESFKAASLTLTENKALEKFELPQLKELFVTNG